MGVGGADGGRGGSSPFVLIDEPNFVDEEDEDPVPVFFRVDVVVDESEPADPSERAVPLFSHVRGGPDT